jgi:hypothetical protein
MATYGPAMVEVRSSRRQVLRLGVGGTLALTSLGLGGCGGARYPLVASRGEISASWTTRLPKPWQPQWLDGGPAAVRALLSGPALRRPALAQLSDGWAATLDRRSLQPIGTQALLARLDPVAAAVARLFTPDGGPLLAFPWSLNPWVLVLRSRPDLVRRRAEGWELLLDPSLTGSVVLPSSPRVSLALMEEDPERLRRLRAQALAYDDRDGLSLLLAGEAQAAVLPRQRVVSLMRRDPRLAVVLPEQGAPLAWGVLVSPAGAPPAPLDWLAEVLQPPLLARLLTAGWVPPLPASQLAPELARLPEPLRAVLLPEPAVLARCRSLPPLDSDQRRRLQALWDGAAPPGAR